MFDANFDELEVTEVSLSTVFLCHAPEIISTIRDL